MEQNNKPNNKINSLLETTLGKIRELVDSETVIGEPMVISPRLTLIPISKMSFGFASGGSDFSGKDNPNIHFGGGSGAGVTVNPLGFLSIADGTQVTFVPVGGGGASSPIEGVLAALPDTVSKFKDMFGKKKSEDEEDIPED
ncbi:MAG: sporulation protein YtfJ [Clostridia bacterium]|nr:sporulation protein YtfJ [Clostridia bacterium]